MITCPPSRERECLDNRKDKDRITVTILYNHMSNNYTINIMNLFDVPNQQELVAKRIQRIFGINMNVVLTEDDDE